MLKRIMHRKNQTQLPKSKNNGGSCVGGIGGRCCMMAVVSAASSLLVAVWHTRWLKCMRCVGYGDDVCQLSKDDDYASWKNLPLNEQ